MKNLFFALCLAVLSNTFVNGQIVDIPDVNFLAALIGENVDTNGDGLIQVSEALSKTSLNFNYDDFASAEGINSFVNLTSLYVRYNDLLQEVNIDNLDKLNNCYIENNGLLSSVHITSASSFSTIEIEYNPIMTNVDLDIAGANRLHLRYNNSLGDLQIEGSPTISTMVVLSNNSLTDIDFSSLSDINSLTLNSNNSITAFDFTGLSNLTTLIFDSNNSVSSIDLGPLVSLTNLTIDSNPSLLDIDFGENPSINSFSCVDNPSLSVIDFSSLSSLTSLTIDGNSSITALDFTGLNSLSTLTVRESPSLLSLDVTNTLPSLTTLSVIQNNSLTSLNLSGSATLQSLTISDNNNLGSLDLSNLNSLATLNVISCGLLDVINLVGLPSLSNVDLDNNNSVSSITLIDLFILTTLTIEDNSTLTDLVYQNLNSLITFTLRDNISLLNFDLENLPSLNTFYCYGNDGIEVLSFDNLPVLTTLDFDYNEGLLELRVEEIQTLKTINLYGHTSLHTISCKNLNSLTSLSVRFGGSLQEIELENLNSLNDLTLNNLGISQFELRDFPSLSTVYIEDALSLDSLTISSLNSLNYLYLSDCNTLSRLQMDTLNSLTRFNMNRCASMEELDLSGLPSLTDIDFNSNNVRYLNVIGVPISADIYVYNEDIEWICATPNQFDWLDSELDLAGVILDPTCNFTGWGDFKPVSLGLYFTEQDDCDGNSQILEQSKFSVISDDLNVIVQPEINASNAYDIDLPPGNYMITPLFDNSSYFSVSPEVLSLNLESTDTSGEGEFCLTSTSDSLLDVSVHIIPLDLARPGFEIEHKIVISNNGNFTTSGEVTYSYSDNLVTYVDSSVPANDLNGMLSFSYDNLSPFEMQEFTITLRLNSPMDTPALDGDEVLYFKSIITGQGLDNNPRDNRYVLCEEVRNAYDPNDKTCLQGPYLLEEMIGDYLSYRIRFENTGNASAVNVRVIDEIDPEYFDITTLTVLEASHLVYTQIRGDEVAFLFDDIYLPFEDDSNDGFVIFEVKTWDHLSIEDNLENTADIYFDFNFPIITNTTSTQVVTDTDMDGYIHLIDCDDNDPTVNPGAEEILYNGVDDDCDPATLDDDFDQDGYGVADDCNDDDSDINPSMDEIPYNGIDDDCDASTLDDDLDQDGYVLLDDCDDSNDNISPALEEIPYNGVDDDCNPLTLDDDIDQDGYILLDDCDDTDESIYLGSVCDDQDECTINDSIDENCNCVGQLQDSDGDGICDIDDDTEGDCTLGAACDDGDICTVQDKYDAECNCAGEYRDSDEDGVCNAEDCKPFNANVYPGNTEIPYNGLDDDCDENTLDDDLDQDGFVFSDDCNDENEAVYPGAICNDNDDCTTNDAYDENCECVGQLEDSDNDGICDGNDATNGDCELGALCDDGDACTIEDSYDSNCNCVGILQDSDNDGVCDSDDNTNGDCELGASCDDNDPCTINDKFDTDCNCIGTFQDSDQDGICDAEDNTNGNCELGESCDDSNDCTINDAIDSDCNCIGEPQDEDPGICNTDCEVGDVEIWDSAICDCVVSEVSVLGCTASTAINYDPSATCDDGSCQFFDCIDLALNIGEACEDGDICTFNDTIDADCNCTGEQYPTFNYYLDADEDGFGSPDSMIVLCSEEMIPIEYIDNNLDCDDTNPNINPNAVDIPNNEIDEDCDGQDFISSTYELDGEQIEIYPNPVSDILRVSSTFIDYLDLQLFDTQGRLIARVKGVSTIDCIHLDEGMYLLKVVDVDSGDFIVERVMVVR